jgi:hypothetical protein
MGNVWCVCGRGREAGAVHAYNRHVCRKLHVRGPYVGDGARVAWVCV